MFKLYKANKAGKFHQNNYRGDLHASDATSHRTGKQRNLNLTNILEEGNSVDEPRSFEQDELYLDECLKALDGNAYELQPGEGDLEEYDFDDYNSVASTASLLNTHAELALDENSLVTRNHAQVSTSENTTLRRHQSKGALTNEPAINGVDKSKAQLTEQLLRISKVQASILKVRDWSKTSGALNKDEWKDVLLEAAHEGDLQRLQEAYSKLGGTSELTIRLTDAFANTALHKAAEAGRMSTLQWLVGCLPNDCLKNITNCENLTPLAVAVKHGSSQCVRWLLEETSAAEEMINHACRSALMHMAIQSGQDESLKCLLAFLRCKNLELDVSDSSGVTLAHVAAWEGRVNCLQVLVDHNIDVTSEDKDGRSPADYAYAAGQTGCGRYLVMEESCWLLSVRVAKLHKELKECKDENRELRQKLEVLESRAKTGMPDRPEAVGGDQSDTSSTSASKSFEDRLSRASVSPDGESPKGFGHERSPYQFHVNGSQYSPEHRPLPNGLKYNVITTVNKEAEVQSARQFEALKRQRRLGTRGSMDSTGSNLSSPVSLSDTNSDNSAMQLVMAKQIAANARRLVMSKHAQKVEESPLIRTRPAPDVINGVPVDEPRAKDSSFPVVLPDTSNSPSSSRSQSPPRTNLISGTSREESSKVKRRHATASEDRVGTSSRLRSRANRRKTPAIGSDSTISSDSDLDHNGQRSNGSRRSRGHAGTNRKEQNGSLMVSHQSVPGYAFAEGKRTHKSVSWKESPNVSTPADEKNNISNEKPRVPPKPPLRTVSRDSCGARARSRDSSAKRTFTPESRTIETFLYEGENTILRDQEAHMIRAPGSSSGRIVLRDSDMFLHRQVPRNPLRGGVNNSAVAPVDRPVRLIEENPASGSSPYSLGGYQQDDRPWYETDELE